MAKHKVIPKSLRDVKATRGTWGALRPVTKVKGNTKKENEKKVCRGKEKDFYFKVS